MSKLVEKVVSQVTFEIGVMQSCAVLKQTRRKMVTHPIVGRDPNATSRL